MHEALELFIKFVRPFENTVIEWDHMPQGLTDYSITKMAICLPECYLYPKLGLKSCTLRTIPIVSTQQVVAQIEVNSYWLLHGQQIRVSVAMTHC